MEIHAFSIRLNNWLLPVNNLLLLLSQYLNQIKYLSAHKGNNIIPVYILILNIKKNLLYADNNTSGIHGQVMSKQWSV